MKLQSCVFIAIAVFNHPTNTVVLGFILLLFVLLVFCLCFACVLLVLQVLNILHL